LTYTRPGLAAAAVQLLGKLAITECVVLGWSLGGHVGIDMLHMLPGIHGLMITGTPPTIRNGMAQGFKGTPHAGMASREHLSDDEIGIFLNAIFGTRPSRFSAKRWRARMDGFANGCSKPRRPAPASTSASQ
jgi:pimeloyl-ACP methyl ester carboxylesterase